jgi:hypothetical protein
MIFVEKNTIKEGLYKNYANKFKIPIKEALQMKSIEK